MSEMTFESWMNLVNIKLASRIGLSSEDIEDQNYYDMYEDGYSPADAVSEILENLELDF